MALNKHDWLSEVGMEVGTEEEGAKVSVVVVLALPCPSMRQNEMQSPPSKSAREGWLEANVLLYFHWFERAYLFNTDVSVKTDIIYLIALYELAMHRWFCLFLWLFFEAYIFGRHLLQKL